MEVLVYILMFVLGSCFGSFLCCQVRRHQLKRSSKKTKKLNSRSVCLKCHYQLKWYDNIPIISWLALSGKCRKCKKPIGYAEILSEICVGLAFLAISIPFDFTHATLLEWASFIVTLVFVLVLSFLAIYDGISGELPTSCLGLAIIIALVLLGIKEYAIISTAPFTPDLIWKPALSVAILGGLYLVLYLISKGKWVGDGDWLLGTAIGIALFQPVLALVALFLANLVASFVMLPFVIRAKKHRIHFGPFLVIAFVLTQSLSSILLQILSL